MVLRPQWGTRRDRRAFRRILCRDQAIRIGSWGQWLRRALVRGGSRQGEEALSVNFDVLGRDRPGADKGGGGHAYVVQRTRVGTHNRLECHVLSSRRFQADRCRCPRRIFWADSDHLINDPRCSHVAEFSCSERGGGRRHQQRERDDDPGDPARHHPPHLRQVWFAIAPAPLIR
jgi:hypothetical protein